MQTYLHSHCYQKNDCQVTFTSGPSSLGVPGVPGHTQILADQLTLYQPGGTDYAHLITTGTPRFSDLQTSLHGCDHTSKKGIKCTKDIEWLRFYCSNLYTVTTGKTGNQIGSKLVSVSTQFPKTLSYFCQFDSSS